ncbi:uncharacterized [Tachysurus ichikawai]
MKYLLKAQVVQCTGEMKQKLGPGSPHWMSNTKECRRILIDKVCSKSVRNMWVALSLVTVEAGMSLVVLGILASLKDKRSNAGACSPQAG